MKRYLRSRLEAYCEKKYQPKLHFCLHFANLTRRSPLVPCWVHDRTHKEIKRFSTDACNASVTTSFELGVLKQVTLVQVNYLKELQVGEGFRLINPGEASDVMSMFELFGLPPLVPLNFQMGMATFFECIHHMPFQRCNSCQCKRCWNRWWGLVFVFPQWIQLCLLGPLGNPWWQQVSCKGWSGILTRKFHSAMLHL